MTQKHIGTSGTPLNLTLTYLIYLATDGELRDGFFAEVSGTHGAYGVSASGVVVSLLWKTSTQGIPVELTPCENQKGYLYVCIDREGVDDTRQFVHRLVAETFLRVDDGVDTLGNLRLQVNHMDCDKKNNRVANLVFMSQWENLAWNSRLAEMKNEARV